MEFRLVYEGPLHAASGTDSRADEKRTIRKALHPQLRELWSQDQRLHFISLNDHIHQDHIRVNHGEWSFIPLVCSYLGIVCSLNILFLRRESPGSLVRTGGDLDNRLKVLLDALRMPQTTQEIGSAPPAADETPLYCLLEDDALITELKVTTDRLLVPCLPPQRAADVKLIIHVTTFRSVLRQSDWPARRHSAASPTASSVLR